MGDDRFDPDEDWREVHWADEEDEGYTTRRGRKRSLTPVAQEKPTKKFKSIIKASAGLTSENWQNLTPALVKHIAHHADAGHKLSAQVVMDCEHNHQSTVTADMTDHMLETWEKKGVTLDGATQKVFVLCDRPGYKQGMVVSAKPADSEDWHYLVYHFDPPPASTTNAIYEAFKNQFNHPPDGVFNVPTAGTVDLQAQANTLYKRAKYHQHNKSPQAADLHKEFVAVTKKLQDHKEGATKNPPQHPPQVVNLYGDDIPALPPLPQVQIPSMYPQDGEGQGGLVGFFTNVLGEFFNPQDIIEGLFSLAAL